MNRKLSACYTHHHLSGAAQSLAVVVRGNHMKFEVGASHVPVDDGRLNHACEGLNNKSVFTVGGRGDVQSVHHAAVIPRVFIQRLPQTTHVCQRLPEKEPQDTLDLQKRTPGGAHSSSFMTLWLESTAQHLNPSLR